MQATQEKPATPADEMEKKLGDAERARDEYLSMLKAKQAEFENYQKRAARERAEEMKYFIRALAADLLPALDNLERALAAASGDNNPLVQGVAGTHKIFLDVLARHGVHRLDVKSGTPLNPNEHQAVSQQPSNEIPNGAITQVLAAGYKIHDRILRPASVVVSSGPPTEEKPK